ncbi:MAG TPA: thioredoxin [Firmicutes bacterium]|nr:thioredoxin [Bacillota bacterium]
MNLADVLQYIEQEEWVLLYFKNNHCSVCGVLLLKVQVLLLRFPKIKILVIDTDECLNIAASFNIYSAPALMVYIDGKEYIREAGIMSVTKLEQDIKRLDGLFNQ